METRHEVVKADKATSILAATTTTNVVGTSIRREVLELATLVMQSGHCSALGVEEQQAWLKNFHDILD